LSPPILVLMFWDFLKFVLARLLNLIRTFMHIFDLWFSRKAGSVFCHFTNLQFFEIYMAKLFLKLVSRKVFSLHYTMQDVFIMCCGLKTCLRWSFKRKFCSWTCFFVLSKLLTCVTPFLRFGNLTQWWQLLLFVFFHNHLQNIYIQKVPQKK